jgi:hypothetical protein
MSMLENILLDCLKEGIKYSSAQDFYEKRIKGKSFLINADDAALEMFKKADQQEVERLQSVYADRWVQ